MGFGRVCVLFMLWLSPLSLLFSLYFSFSTIRCAKSENKISINSQSVCDSKSIYSVFRNENENMKKKNAVGGREWSKKKKEKDFHFDILSFFRFGDRFATCTFSWKYRTFITAQCERFKQKLRIRRWEHDSKKDTSDWLGTLFEAIGVFKRRHSWAGAYQLHIQSHMRDWMRIKSKENEVNVMPDFELNS